MAADRYRGQGEEGGVSGCRPVQRAGRGRWRKRRLVQWGVSVRDIRLVMIHDRAAGTGIWLQEGEGLRMHSGRKTVALYMTLLMASMLGHAASVALPPRQEAPAASAHPSPTHSPTGPCSHCPSPLRGCADVRDAPAASPRAQPGVKPTGRGQPVGMMKVGGC